MGYIFFTSIIILALAGAAAGFGLFILVFMEVLRERKKYKNERGNKDE